MAKERFKKFIINNKVFVLNIVLGLVFLAIFVVFLVLTNSGFSDSLSEKMYNTLVIFKEASLVGATLFIGSVISASVLERKSKNSEYVSDTINNVVCDPKVFKTLSEENRKFLKTHLFGFENVSQIDMLESIISKLKDFKYYYEECILDVSCDINRDSCCKKISKTLKVRSFSESFEISNYRLYSSDTKETSNNYLTFSLIKIGDKVLKKDLDYRVKKEIVKVEERTGLRKGHKDYKNRYICELVNPLKVFDNKSVNITLVYETNVTNDDCFINRLPGPCKKYRLSFGISSAKSNEYDVNGSAFGFMDRGDRTPNIEDNRLVFDFDSWSFKDDGVSLSYKKKKK